MIDIAIVSLPRLDLTRPAIAPGILASLSNKAGMTNKIFDFALETYERSTKEEWTQYELFWQIDLGYKLDQTYMDKLENLFDQYISEVLQHEPSIIAISVFSHNSINATEMFLERLRIKTDAKIMIGGQGIQSKYSSKTFGEDMLERGLIDFF